MTPQKIIYLQASKASNTYKQGSQIRANRKFVPFKICHNACWDCCVKPKIVHRLYDLHDKTPLMMISLAPKTETKKGVQHY